MAAQFVFNRIENLVDGVFLRNFEKAAAGFVRQVFEECFCPVRGQVRCRKRGWKRSEYRRAGRHRWRSRARHRCRYHRRRSARSTPCALAACAEPCRCWTTTSRGACRDRRLLEFVARWRVHLREGVVQVLIRRGEGWHVMTARSNCMMKIWSFFSPAPGRENESWPSVRHRAPAPGSCWY